MEKTYNACWKWPPLVSIRKRQRFTRLRETFRDICGVIAAIPWVIRCFSSLMEAMGSAKTKFLRYLTKSNLVTISLDYKRVIVHRPQGSHQKRARGSPSSRLQCALARRPTETSSLPHLQLSNELRYELVIHRSSYRRC